MDHIDEQAEDNFIQISIISSDPMIVIQFTSAKNRIQYRLENYTSHEIEYTQNLSEKSYLQPKIRVLKPGKKDLPSIENYA